MNPCPCGFFTDPQKECTCTPLQIQRYRSKVSGPLLDRIDIQIEVPTLRYQELAGKEAGEPSTVSYFLFHPRSPSHVSNVYWGSQPKISFALRMLVTGQNSSQISL
jgi:hypothetical protein